MRFCPGGTRRARRSARLRRLVVKCRERRGRRETSFRTWRHREAGLRNGVLKRCKARRCHLARGLVSCRRGSTSERRGASVRICLVVARCYWRLLQRGVRIRAIRLRTMRGTSDHHLWLGGGDGHDDASVGGAWIATIFCRWRVVIVSEDRMATTLLLPVWEVRVS